MKRAGQQSSGQLHRSNGGFRRTAYTRRGYTAVAADGVEIGLAWSLQLARAYGRRRQREKQPGAPRDALRGDAQGTRCWSIHGFALNAACTPCTEGGLRQAGRMMSRRRRSALTEGEQTCLTMANSAPSCAPAQRERVSAAASGAAFELQQLAPSTGPPLMSAAGAVTLPFVMNDGSSLAGW